MDCETGICVHQAKETRTAHTSLWTWVVLALIPKCPLCILSFSSAISLCGGKTIFENAVGWTSYIPIGLALIVIASFIYNFKGKKTIAAIVLAALACLIILFGEYITKNVMTYYMGVIVLFFACWVNGSFQYFLKKIKSVGFNFNA